MTGTALAGLTCCIHFPPHCNLICDFFSLEETVRNQGQDDPENDDVDRNSGTVTEVLVHKGLLVHVRSEQFRPVAAAGQNKDEVENFERAGDGKDHDDLDVAQNKRDGQHGCLFDAADSFQLGCFIEIGGNLGHGGKEEHEVKADVMPYGRNRDGFQGARFAHPQNRLEAQLGDDAVEQAELVVVDEHEQEGYRGSGDDDREEEDGSEKLLALGDAVDHDGQHKRDSDLEDQDVKHDFQRMQGSGAQKIIGKKALVIVQADKFLVEEAVCAEEAEIEAFQERIVDKGAEQQESRQQESQNIVLIALHSITFLRFIVEPLSFKETRRPSSKRAASRVGYRLDMDALLLVCDFDLLSGFQGCFRRIFAGYDALDMLADRRERFRSDLRVDRSVDRRSFAGHLEAVQSELRQAFHLHVGSGRRTGVGLRDRFDRIRRRQELEQLDGSVFLVRVVVRALRQVEAGAEAADDGLAVAFAAWNGRERKHGRSRFDFVGEAALRPRAFDDHGSLALGVVFRSHVQVDRGGVFREGAELADLVQLGEAELPVRIDGIQNAGVVACAAGGAEDEVLDQVVRLIEWSGERDDLVLVQRFDGRRELVPVGWKLQIIFLEDVLVDVQAFVVARQRSGIDVAVRLLDGIESRRVEAGFPFCVLVEQSVQRNDLAGIDEAFGVGSYEVEEQVRLVAAGHVRVDLRAEAVVVRGHRVVRDFDVREFGGEIVKRFLESRLGCVRSGEGGEYAERDVFGFRSLGRFRARRCACCRAWCRTCVSAGISGVVVSVAAACRQEQHSRHGKGAQSLGLLLHRR
ncbi:hypothetical protein BN871_CK_00320 [Paenibacillus sp. P22]|nr:hypothetical protein BN871_CK_00320 [Paenibacillus sp. P22]